MDKPILLIADDDRSLLLSLSIYFTTSYHVVLASDGADALDCYRQYGDQIAALLTDWQMPQVNGMALIETLRREGATFPMVLMSGNGRALEANSWLTLHNAVLVQKPFSFELAAQLLLRARSASAGSAS